MTNGQAGGTPNVAGRIRDLQVEPDRRPAGLCGVGRWRRVVLRGPRRHLASRSTTGRPADRGQSATSPAPCRAARSTSSGAPADGSAGRGLGGHRRAVAHRQRPAGDRAAAQPAGLPSGKLVAGIGFLNRDPAVAGGGVDDRQGRRGCRRRRTRCAARRSTASPPIPTRHTRINWSPRPPRVSTSSRPGGRGRSSRRCAQRSGATDGRRGDPPTRPTGAHLGRPAPAACMVAEFTRRTGHGDQPRRRCRSQSVALPDVYTETLTGGTVVGTCLQLATDGIESLRARPRRDRRPREPRTTPPAAAWTIDATAASARRPERHRDHATALTGTRGPVHVDQ